MKSKNENSHQSLKVWSLVSLAAIVLVIAIAAQNFMRTPAAPMIEDVSGTWSGTANVSDGTELNYQLTLTQWGTDVRGKAQSSDFEGVYTAYVRGTYVGGVLTLREYDEVSQSNLCYWSLTLNTSKDGSQDFIAGSYEDIRNSDGSCTLNGDVRLSKNN